MLISFFRVIKLSFQDLRRNAWLSIATIFVLVLTLISVNGLVALNFLMKSAARSVQNKVDVSLYFKPDISSERAREVRNILNKIAGVLSVKLVLPEEALAQFENRYERDQGVLEALKIVEKNPFGPTLVIKAASPDIYQNVLETLKNPGYQTLIADQTFDDHAMLIEKIGEMTRKLNQLGVGVSAVFGFLALVVAMTMVRVAIYTQRETIGIMKLVGASNWFVRMPYLIQGAVLSVLAVGVSIGIVYPLLTVLEPRLTGIFGSEALELSKYFSDSFWTILGAELGGAVVLNLMVTGFAVGRYLKV